MELEVVEQMLELHKQLSSPKTAHEKTITQRQITTTDNQIDQSVGWVVDPPRACGR